MNKLIEETGRQVSNSTVIDSFEGYQIHHHSFW